LVGWFISVVPRVTLVRCFIGLLCLLVTAPFVRAQTTSVTILTAPSQAPLQSDGTAHFDATVRVTVMGIPYTTASSGDFYLLIVALGLSSDMTSPNVSVGGSADSNPNECLPNSLTGAPSGYTDCFILPFCQFASSCIETDDVTFHTILSNAIAQQYHFKAIAFLVYQTPQAGNKLGVPVITGPNGSSWSTADFYVDVANNPIPQYTTPTYAAYAASSYATTPYTTTSEAPSTLTVSPNVSLGVIAVTLAAILAIGAVIYYWPRRTETAKGPADVEPVRPEPFTHEIPKITRDKQFCIECRTELPVGSKFCNKCGAKQE